MAFDPAKMIEMREEGNKLRERIEQDLMETIIRLNWPEGAFHVILMAMSAPYRIGVIAAKEASGMTEQSARNGILRALSAVTDVNLTPSEVSEILGEVFGSQRVEVHTEKDHRSKMN